MSRHRPDDSVDRKAFPTGHANDDRHLKPASPGDSPSIGYNPGEAGKMNAPHRFSPNPRVEQAIEYALRLGLDARWETNGKGQIVVNPPVGLLHAKRFDRIAQAIRRALPDWQVWTEVGLHTGDGVKAPDLLAASPSYAENVDARGFLLSAPELCVEVMSPSNSWEEMRHKALLYLAAGAQEAWVCDEGGELRFFGGAGERDESVLVPGMAKRVD